MGKLRTIYYRICTRNSGKITTKLRLCFAVRLTMIHDKCLFLTVFGYKHITHLLGECL